MGTGASKSLENPHKKWTPNVQLLIMVNGDQYPAATAFLASSPQELVRSNLLCRLGDVDSFSMALGKNAPEDFLIAMTKAIAVCIGQEYFKGVYAKGTTVLHYAGRGCDSVEVCMYLLLVASGHINTMVNGNGQTPVATASSASILRTASHSNTAAISALFREVSIAIS